MIGDKTHWLLRMKQTLQGVSEQFRHVDEHVDVRCPHDNRWAPPICYQFGPVWEGWPVLHCELCHECADVLMQRKEPAMAGLADMEWFL